MRIVAVSMVKNEVDIVEAFVRHTLAVVDRLVVCDNGSTDGTREVLRALEAEGLSLDVVEETPVGKHQARRVTRLMREFAVGRYAADWVVLLDADEFVRVPAGEPVVEPGPPADRPLLLAWLNYLPDSRGDPWQVNPVLRMRWRGADPVWDGAKVMIPGTLAALPDATVTPGNHSLVVGGLEHEPLRQERLCLGHFPYRSPGQYAAKIVINVLQLDAIGADPTRHGFYRRPFEEIRDDPRVVPASVRGEVRGEGARGQGEAKRAVVVDPFPYRGGPLRYTPGVDDDVRAWRATVRYAEALARAYAEVTRERDRLAADLATLPRART